MKSIEITTTQNVTIDYQLAAVADRLFAFLIDLGFIIILLLILNFIYTAIFPYSFQRYLVYTIDAPVFLLYALISELIGNGQSIGKRIIGIKIVKLDGSQAGLIDYMMRWTFRIVDIYLSLGSVAVILISSTDESQRLGDMLANTVMIKTGNLTTLHLKDLEKIHSRTSYEPKFLEVKTMSEEEMLILKNTLERSKQYANDAHQQALKLAAKTVRQRLKIEEIIDDKVLLQTLINDFVVLTR